MRPACSASLRNQMLLYQPALPTPLVGGAALERHADGVGTGTGTGTEGERDARRQPETGRGPKHQHPFGPVERSLRPDAGNLLHHGGAAADGVAVAGNTALDLRVNDHRESPGKGCNRRNVRGGPAALGAR